MWSVYLLNLHTNLVLLPPIASNLALQTHTACLPDRSDAIPATNSLPYSIRPTANIYYLLVDQGILTLGVLENLVQPRRQIFRSALGLDGLRSDTEARLSREDTWVLMIGLLGNVVAATSSING